MINFIGLEEQKIILGDKIQKRIQGVIDHGKFILGPEVNQLEERLADYVGAKHCISCSSGTDALLMSLMASGIGKNDAVITSPFSYIATAEVIELLGAKVYFCDISEQTYNLDCSILDLNKLFGIPNDDVEFDPTKQGSPSDVVDDKMIKAREKKLEEQDNG